jgi:hypothetical protein
MLTEVDPEGVIKAVSVLASEAKSLALHHEILLRTNTSEMPLTPDGVLMCLRSNSVIGGSAEALAMIGVQRAVERLEAWLIDAGERKVLSPGQISQLSGGLMAVVQSYGDELDGRKIFVMTPQYAQYHAPDKPPFGDAVFNAFPDANNDIAEAGKCLSLGCGTACVMHLMRALEVGLKAVAKEFGIEDKNDWGTYLREIEKELKARETAGKKRSADEQFYADASAQLGNLKVAYRNPTMHVGSDYSEDRAEEILVATRAFLRHLAPRFAAMGAA